MSEMTTNKQLIQIGEDLLSICRAYKDGSTKLYMGQSTCSKILEAEGQEMLHEANLGYQRCKRWLQEIKENEDEN